MPMIKKLTALAGTAAAARGYIRKNPEKVNQLAAKAGAFVDKRTKGKYHDKIDGALHKVRNATSPHGKPGEHGTPGTPGTPKV